MEKPKPPRGYIAKDGGGGGEGAFLVLAIAVVFTILGGC